MGTAYHTAATPHMEQMKGCVDTYGQIHQIGNGKYQHIPGASQNSVRTRLHTDEHKEVGDKGRYPVPAP